MIVAILQALPAVLKLLDLMIKWGGKLGSWIMQQADEAHRKQSQKKMARAIKEAKATKSTEKIEDQFRNP